MADTFTALVAEQADGRTVVKRTSLDEAALPPGDVTIDIAHSSLNYKDGLALTGRGKVIRKWPMGPASTSPVGSRSSTSQRFRPGDPVLVTGYGLGVGVWGGGSQRARVKESVVIPNSRRARQPKRDGHRDRSASPRRCACSRSRTTARSGPTASSL